MRIRLQFAGVFFFLLLVAGYAGLSSLQFGEYINDKFLHFLTFFALTLVFYWIIDTNRRRTLNLTLVVCTGVLGVGSEFVQGFLPNGRVFDVYDIAANVVGSLSGLWLCYWYHKRMLERKRRRRGYSSGGDEEQGLTEDVELGEGIRRPSADLPAQETGVTAGPSNASTGPKTLEERVDEWDENQADTWTEDDLEEEDITAGNGTAPAARPDVNAPKKRTD